MRRIAAAFAALALVALAAPADAGAGGQPDHCREKGYTTPSGDAHVYLQVCWDDMGGGSGIKVTDVQERVTGGFWEATAFNCDFVAVWNDKATKKWSRTGNACDIPRNLGYRVFDNMALQMPQSNTASVTLAGWPQLDAERDPGYQTITVNIQRGG